jgi:hypothetical protein
MYELISLKLQIIAMLAAPFLTLAACFLFASTIRLLFRAPAKSDIHRVAVVKR